MLTARPLLFLFFLAGGILTVALLGALVFGLLAATGSPGEEKGLCRNTSLDLEDPVSPGVRDALDDPALADQWQGRWEAFQAEAAAGTTQVSFEEGEVTSRASRYMDEEDIPLKRVTVCFYDGEAEARATLDAPAVGDLPVIGGLFETDVKARGRIDLSGEHPRIDITEIEAGKLPGFTTGWVEDDIESLVNDKLEALTLPRPYNVTFVEGRVDISSP